MDLANSIPESLVEVSATPQNTSYVTDEIKIVVGLIIGIFGSVALAMFCFIIVHRKHRVLTLAQGDLLAWHAFAAFTTIIFTFLFLPTKDSFCRLRGLVLIPCTMMVNIMVGRLWRVYTTLCVANKLGRSSSFGLENRKGSRLRNIISEERVMNFLGFLAFSRLLRKKSASGRRSSSLRQVTTLKDTVRLIIVLSIPQTVLQVFVAAYFDSNSIIEIVDEQYAHEKCDDEEFTWVKYVGVLLLALAVTLTLYVAWCSRVRITFSQGLSALLLVSYILFSYYFSICRLHSMKKIKFSRLR